jgi:hypothetical protein
VDAGQIILYFNDQLLNDYDSLKTVPLGISDIIGMLLVIQTTVHFSVINRF